MFELILFNEKLNGIYFKSSVNFPFEFLALSAVLAVIQ